MKHLFAPLLTALSLKEKGFDEQCFGIFNSEGTLIIEDQWLYATNSDTMNETDNPTAPLYQQVIDWLRSKEVKIVEDRQFGWNVCLKVDDRYFLSQGYSTLDEAITYGLTQI